MPQLDQQTLLERESIRDVLARYARGIDRMDFELVRSCYHLDAIDDHGMYVGDIDGFIEYLESPEALAGFIGTMHFFGNQLIEVDGEQAHAETYCVAYHRTPAGAGQPELDITIWLRYVDRLERRDGEWKISHRVCLYDYSRTDPVDEQFDFPASAKRSRRDREDLVYG